jgi:hypothetical protein
MASQDLHIPDACDELGIQESMFHRVRSEVLQTALGRLEPRPIGRPPQQPMLHDPHRAELEEEILRLRAALKAAEVRRELAENLPRLARSATRPGKKTTEPAKKHGRRQRKTLRERA